MFLAPSSRPWSPGTLHSHSQGSKWSNVPFQQNSLLLSHGASVNCKQSHSRRRGAATQPVLIHNVHTFISPEAWVPDFHPKCGGMNNVMIWCWQKRTLELGMCTVTGIWLKVLLMKQLFRLNLDFGPFTGLNNKLGCNTHFTLADH